MAELYHLLKMFFSAIVLLIGYIGSIGQFLYPWGHKVEHKKEVVSQVRIERLILSQDGLILSLGGRPLNGISIEYPRAMIQAGKEGKVSLSCDIEETGVTSHCHITQSSGEESFDAESLQYVRQAHYKPKLNHGIAVKEYARQYLFQFQKEQ